MPLRDAMTTGLTPGLILVDDVCAVAVTGVEAAIPAAALEITKSRRLIFLFIFPPIDGLVTSWTTAPIVSNKSESGK